jgi:hypothetical protein
MKIFLIVLIFGLSAKAKLEEVVAIDKIEIVDGFCYIRQASRVLRDGIEISSTYHRWAIEPGGDLSHFDSRVKAICKAAWTADVVKKYKDAQQKNNIK